MAVSSGCSIHSCIVANKAPSRSSHLTPPPCNVVFSQDGAKHELGSPNPFAEGGEDLASACYRYRKWALSSELDIVVRCEVNAAVTTPKGEVQLAVVKVRRWGVPCGVCVALSIGGARGATS